MANVPIRGVGGPGEWARGGKGGPKSLFAQLETGFSYFSLPGMLLKTEEGEHRDFELLSRKTVWSGV